MVGRCWRRMRRVGCGHPGGVLAAFLMNVMLDRDRAAERGEGGRFFFLCWAALMSWQKPAVSAGLLDRRSKMPAADSAGGRDEPTRPACAPVAGACLAASRNRWA